MTVRIVVLAVATVVTALASWLWPRVDRPPTRSEVARQLMEDGRPGDAALLFDDPLWRGVAEHRAGRHQRALGEFRRVDSTLALYNLGTTHARMRAWPAAAAALELVLRLDPDHADARHNLEVVRAAIALARSKTADNPSEQPLDDEGETKQDPSKHASDDPSQAQSGDTDAGENTADDESEQQGEQSSTPGELADEERTEQKGTAVAFGEPQDQGERFERDVSGLTLLKARESAQAAEMLLRHIRDDPEKVLRARLYTAHQTRRAAARP